MNQKIDYETIAEKAWSLSFDAGAGSEESELMKDCALAIRDLQSKLATETGLTPRQLLEQRDALKLELEGVREWAVTERAALRKQEIESIDRVLALVKGETQ